MPIGIVIAILIGGLGVGFGASQVITKQKLGDADKKAQQDLDDAKAKAKEMILEAKEEVLKIKEDAKKEESERRKELTELEQRNAKREETLDSKLEEIEKRSEIVKKSEEDLDELKNKVREIQAKQQEGLEKISKMTKADAAQKLMEITEKQIKDDLVGLISKLQEDAKDHAEEKAQMILTQAMERMASEVTAEKTVTALELKDDQMKGRIIGKEGRNIQAIERATGVDVLVDETPGMVILSSFDPIRRQVAREALEMLMKDGRIHPGRVEEVVAKAQQNIEKEVMDAGEAAVREVGALGLPKQVVELIGQLKYRTSFGQNVLKHSTEMAHMAGLIAEEIGADVKIAKTAALIHDMGKALTHKMEGKHHHISGEMARKYGVDERIAHAAEAHHDDIEATTVEAMIIRAVDAMSASRPGARKQSTENFAERMRDLENVANEFGGVHKSYAISAGREIRVFVNAEQVDDLSAIRMARDIATKIESTMQYPGTIKVNVIRETRAVEFAK